MQNLQFVALWCPLAPYPPAGQARADPGQGQGGGAVGHEGKGAGGGASGDTAEDAPPPLLSPQVGYLVYSKFIKYTMNLLNIQQIY